MGVSMRMLALIYYLVCLIHKEASGYENVIHDTMHLQPHAWEQPVSEELYFNDDSVWVLKSEDGMVNIHDYNTGLHIARQNAGGACFVYPTPHSYEDGMELLRTLENGKRTFRNIDVVRLRPLSPSSIRDTSFLPAEAAEYCTGGYQWAEVIEYLLKSAEMTDGYKRKIEKRQADLDLVSLLANRRRSSLSVCPR